MAGNGRLVGLGGGGALVGHEHVLGGITGSSHPDWLTLWMEVWGPVGGGVLVCRASCWCSAGGLACRSAGGWWGSRVGPIALLLPEGGMGVLRGKSLGISPRSAQVAMLRYSLLAISEKYTICLVSRPVGWALILSKAAPMIGRLVPLAECITRFTGIRSAADRRRPDRRLGPARQLWQPVSAMAVVARLWVSVRRVWPWYLKSSARAEIETSMFGCGGDLFRLQRWDWVPGLVVEGSFCHGVDLLEHSAFVLDGLPTHLGGMVLPAA